MKERLREHRSALITAAVTVSSATSTLVPGSATRASSANAAALSEGLGAIEQLSVTTPQHLVVMGVSGSGKTRPPPPRVSTPPSACGPACSSPSCARASPRRGSA